MSDRIQRAFEDFHRKNPEVYETLVDIARGYERRGQKRGIKHIWEIARYRLDVANMGKDTYKLNNNFTSRYARLIMRQEFDLQDFFELRELQTEEAEQPGQLGLL